MNLSWKKFTALGTEVILSAVLNVDQEDLLTKTEAQIKDFEQRFSRFIKDNELANFNQAEGEITVSSDFLEIIKDLQKWQQFSQNIFDPTIINNLEELGYDKSFLEIKTSPINPDVEKLNNFSNRAKLSQVIIKDDVIVKPRDLRLDLGGFGKGYILDQLGQDIFLPVNSYWLSAGGDLLIKGHDINQIGWRIDVQNPYEPTKQIFTIKTKGETLGIATSGVWQRKGIKGDKEWHHLIDPRTGLSADNDILAVTAIAPSASQADVLAKTILILGPDQGLDFVEKVDNSAALIFLKDGGIIFSTRVKNYL